jgi:RNA polymerase sigma-70 factor (ECF subfamily)
LDRNTFEFLFRKEFKGLVVFATGYVKDVDVAKDIVHDGFLILWERKEQMNLAFNIKSFLTTTIRNRCLNYLRDNKKFDNTLFALEDHLARQIVEPPDTVVESETKERIESAINELPEKCREVFMMNRFQGKKYREVADLLGISIKTVEAQMSKALELLRKRLKSSDSEIQI